ncbi:MAG: ribonuclease HII [Deferribacterales bacterium]
MLTVGIDEVGRGCLAGPVVACAVILPEDFSDARLVDSKKISEKQRKIMDRVVRDNALAIGIGIVDNGDIDRINILNATKTAMMQALSQIEIEYHKVIVDAVDLKDVKVPLEHPFKAEDKFQCVAAASIVAKVFRDALMTKMHIDHPQYDWYSNKGYGTKKHTDAIKQFGLTPLHRVSFCGNFI